MESANALPLVIAASHVFHVQRLSVVQKIDVDNDANVNDALSISSIKEGVDQFEKDANDDEQIFDYMAERSRRDFIV